MASRKVKNKIVKSKSKNTVLRDSLKKESALQRSVFDGLGGIEPAHKNYFDQAVRADFEDSMDLDLAVRDGREQENRWDYLLGHTPTKGIIAVEPHSAKQDEVATVIRKKAAAKQHIAEHLKDGKRVTKWIWVASGKVHFLALEKTKLQLAQSGIEFVGGVILPKHIN